MIWSAIFLISITQGLFLISLIAIRGSKNPLASHLIIALLLLMIFTNFGYIVARTDLKNYIPQFFAFPFGMMFLYGPLFYLYSRSVIDNSFHWENSHLLHFIPYFLQFLINIPLLITSKAFLIGFIEIFLRGDLPIRGAEKIIFAVQDLQLFIYLFFTFRWIQSAKSNYGNAQYIISLSSRIKWLTSLAYCFFLFLITVSSLYVFIVVNGKYNPVTNYVYTLITSGIIYFIAYKLVLNPELISPGFSQKYKAYMQFIGEDGEKYLQKLKMLMDEGKVFTNPELKLSLLAEQLGLPSHQVSKLINEKFGKSFNDFVNEYRVREFIDRVNSDHYSSYSIYGIALEVGFNSKSSFNTTFKRITGKTPSEYKPA